MFFTNLAPDTAIPDVYTLQHIRRTLDSHVPTRVPVKASTRQAAVAIIVREAAHDLEMLFIRRAEKVGDPWSGHMAFPGGHRDPGDESLQAAARRETLEEIALDLDHGLYLGALDHQHAQPRGRILDMLIAPHVFQIEGDPDLSPNYEVAEIVWTPVAPMVRNEIHDTETKPMQGTPTVFNGYRLPSGHFVWGLTYRILKEFFATLDPAWEPPREL